MTRINKAVFLLAALGWAAGLAVSPAVAQDSQPAPGFSPGQPYVVTIQGERGTPLMVVHVGRIPLASESQVELLLPDLGASGLAYAVSTLGGPMAQCVPPADPYPDSAKKKPQEVVGRIHTVVILSPLNPAIGQDAETYLTLGANGLDHGLVPNGVPGDVQECGFGGCQIPDAGVVAAGDGVLGLDPTATGRGISGGRLQGLPHDGGPPGGGPPPDGDDLYGGERRPMVPVDPVEWFPGTGPATPVQVDGVLSDGVRVPGFDPGGSGPQELATETCSFGGYLLPTMVTPIAKEGVLDFGDSRPRLSLGIFHSGVRSKSYN